AKFNLDLLYGHNLLWVVYFQEYIDRAEPGDQDWASAHLELAWHAYREDTETSRAKAERLALIAYNHLLDTPMYSPDLGAVEVLLGLLASYRRDWDSSVRYLRAAAKHVTTDPFSTVSMLATTLCFAGRPEEALALYENELSGDIGAFRLAGVPTARVYETLQLIHRKLGNFDTAMQYIDAWEQSETPSASHQGGFN